MIADPAALGTVFERMAAMPDDIQALKELVTSLAICGSRCFAETIPDELLDAKAVRPDGRSDRARGPTREERGTGFVPAVRIGKRSLRWRRRDVLAYLALQAAGSR